MSQVSPCLQFESPQQALFSCVACGYTYHADIVAAMNILALGHREGREDRPAPLQTRQRLNACSPPVVATGILGL
ncbi:MAG TPA: zinc ribbon domain-containing protein [Candidatus Tectomicrobia bacterium]